MLHTFKSYEVKSNDSKYSYLETRKIAHKNIVQQKKHKNTKHMTKRQI